MRCHCFCWFPYDCCPNHSSWCSSVFIDVSTQTSNILCEELESAYNPTKTKAVVLAHALGNPFDIGQVSHLLKVQPVVS